MAVSTGNFSIAGAAVGGVPAKALALGAATVWEEAAPTPPAQPDYLTFTAKDANSTIQLYPRNGSPKTAYLDYSTDGGQTWSEYIRGATSGPVLTANAVGDEICFRASQDVPHLNGSLPDGSDNTSSRYCWRAAAGKWSVKGNIMYMVSPTGADRPLRFWEFINLFSDTIQRSWGSFADLKLPALSAAGTGAYWGMFEKLYTDDPTPPKISINGNLPNNLFTGTFYNCGLYGQLNTISCTGFVEGTHPAGEYTSADRQFYELYYGSSAGRSDLIVDMRQCQSVPSLPNSTLFSTANARSYTVLVPAALCAEWAQTTNWSAIADHLSADAVPVPDYFTFTAGANGSTLKLKGYDNAPQLDLLYSTDDGQTWGQYAVPTTLTCDAGQHVSFRAGSPNAAFSAKGFKRNCFEGTGAWSLSGNVMYLVSPDGSNRPLGELEFVMLCQLMGGALTSIDGLRLPATEISGRGAYWSAFNSTAISGDAPELPARYVWDHQYQDMFKSTQISSFPVLSVTEFGRIDGDTPNHFQSTLAQTRVPMLSVDMTACQSVPTLPSSTLFSICGKPYKVFVPASLYDEWITETNWSAITANIQAV